jgi:hypothetical protein
MSERIIKIILVENKRKIWISYALFATSTLLVKTYIDGKRYLLDFQEDKMVMKPEDIQEKWQNITDEFKACKYGCGRNLSKNVFDSLLFPITFISNIVPYIVLKFNSK